jgi:hypothetical protein
MDVSYLSRALYTELASRDQLSRVVVVVVVGGYGGEELSTEVEKRFRDGSVSRFGLACLAPFPD